MADEQKNATDNGEQEQKTIPEVEAEIVGEDERPASDEALFESEPVAPAGEDKPAPSRTIFSPGVILFAVFVAVALAAMLFWRFTANDAPVPADSNATQSAPPRPSDQADANVSGAAPLQEEPSTGEDAPDAPSSAVADGVLKIENNIEPSVSALKSETPAPQSDGAYLPPLGDPDKQIINSLNNTNLKARLEQETTQADDAPAIESAPDNGLDDQTTGGDEGLAADFADPPPAVENSITIDETASAASAEAIDSESEKNGANDQKDATLAPAPGAVRQNSTLASEVAALRSELGALRAAVETERADRQVMAQDIDTMRSDLAQALSVLNRNMAESFAEMREDIGDLQAEQERIPVNVAANAVALSGVKRALETGSSYSAELNVLAENLPADAEVEVLRAHAQDGVATLETLKIEFADAARAAIAAEDATRANGALSTLAAKAKNLISMRPAAPRSGDHAAAIISRAENALMRNDLDAAIDELSNLSAAAKEAMADWMARAQTRANALSAAAQLDNRLLSASER